MNYFPPILLGLLLVGCQRKVEVSPRGENAPEQSAQLDPNSTAQGKSPPSKQSLRSPPFDNKDAGERVAVVKKLAVKGPDAEGVIPALLAALDDEDEFVKGFAAVALISFGEKARPALEKRKKDAENKMKEKWKELDEHTPVDPDKGKAPNPSRAPENWLAPIDFLVYCNPWFAGRIVPMSLLALKDGDPDFRAVGARALGFLQGGYPTPAPEVIGALKAARSDSHEQVRAAAAQALKMLRR